MSYEFYILYEVMIFVLGAAAVFLLNTNSRWSKYGAILGLLSEPFWLLSAWDSQSWGIFAVSVIYTLSYIMGVYNFWFRKTKKKGKK